MSLSSLPCSLLGVSLTFCRPLSSVEPAADAGYDALDDYNFDE